MDTQQIKDEFEKNVTKLYALRDDVKVRLHLASLDAKKEWDEKLSPRLLEVESAAKNITETTRTTAHELVGKLEDFLGRLKGNDKSNAAH